MKMIKGRKPGFLILLLMVLFLACDSKSPVQTAEKISTKYSRVSDCGGFDSVGKRAAYDILFTRDQSTYCDAEQLLWSYEKNTQTLYVLNSRVYLNCCGDHEITSETSNGIIVISENDQPVDGKYRCRCMCVYDFYIEISGVSQSVITLQLDMTVDNTTLRKWKGKIDLREENGEIVIDDNPLDSDILEVQRPDNYETK